MIRPLPKVSRNSCGSTERVSSARVNMTSSAIPPASARISARRLSVESERIRTRGWGKPISSRVCRRDLIDSGVCAVSRQQVGGPGKTSILAGRRRLSSAACNWMVSSCLSRFFSTVRYRAMEIARSARMPGPRMAGAWKAPWMPSISRRPSQLSLTDPGSATVHGVPFSVTIRSISLWASSGSSPVINGVCGLTMPAFSLAIAVSVLPSNCVCSRPRLVMTLQRADRILVASRRPPRPTSKIAISTLERAKQSMAIAVSNSKKVGLPLSPSAGSINGRMEFTVRMKDSSLIDFPSTRILSRRCSI